MKIDRIYYEELRSICIDGKWVNRKIGMGASLTENESNEISHHLSNLKVAVKRGLDELSGEYAGSNTDKYKAAKEFLLNLSTDIKREVELIDDEMPF